MGQTLPYLLLCSTALLYWSLHYLLRRHLLKNVPKKHGLDPATLSPADVADISTKVLSALNASLSSAVGLYIMWDTMDDCLYSRSEAIVPYTYIGVSYMICDIIAMYHTFCKSRSESGRSVSNFVKSKPLLVLHHLVLVAFYPLLVYDGLRKGMGDFLIGTLFLRELSSPFLAAAKIMRKIGIGGSTVYWLNGVALTCTFFLVRIVNTPLVLLLYSAQHHHWHVYQALSFMRPICHVLLAAEWALQFYWFSQILATGFRSSKIKPS